MKIKLTPIEYINVRTPNKEYMTELVNEIKGKDRSMADFSEDTGVTTSMLSRIINGAYTKPLNMDILVRIMRGAREDCKVRLSDLAHANGMETQDQIQIRMEKEAQKRKEAMDCRERAFQMENIITNRLLDEKYAVRKDRQLRINLTKLQGIFPDEIGGDFKFQVFCEENDFFWHFFLNPTKAIDTGSGTARREARRFFNHYAALFLQSEWESEKFLERKLSFVFADNEYYKAFLELMQQAKIKSEMSAILVDVEHYCVKEETSISKMTFGCTESLLIPRGKVVQENTADEFAESNYGWDCEEEED